MGRMGKDRSETCRARLETPYKRRMSSWGHQGKPREWCQKGVGFRPDNLQAGRAQPSVSPGRVVGPQGQGVGEASAVRLLTAEPGRLPMPLGTWPWQQQIPSLVLILLPVEKVPSSPHGFCCSPFHLVPPSPPHGVRSGPSTQSRRAENTTQ